MSAPGHRKKGNRPWQTPADGPIRRCPDTQKIVARTVRTCLSVRTVGGRGHGGIMAGGPGCSQTRAIRQSEGEPYIRAKRERIGPTSARRSHRTASPRRRRRTRKPLPRASREIRSVPWQARRRVDCPASEPGTVVSLWERAATLRDRAVSPQGCPWRVALLSPPTRTRIPDKKKPATLSGNG